VFPDDRSTADLGQALELIPEQRAEGFTTFCIKPSQFTDGPDDVGRLCHDIVRRVSNLACWRAGVSGRRDVHQPGGREQRGGVGLCGQLNQQGQSPGIALHWICGRVAGATRYRRHRASVVDGQRTA
jgi:hypothetical protein